MIAYEEEVHVRRFISPVRELLHLGGAIAFAGFLYWSELHGKDIRSHTWLLSGLTIFVVTEISPFLLGLNAVLFPRFSLQIDDQVLLLKRGFFRRKIPLETIVEVHPVSASRVRKAVTLQQLYQSLDFLFVDRKELQNIELLLSGGRSKFIASARAEEVARILRHAIERSQREAALRLIAAHNS
jgi:hypothetical protein